MNDLVSVILTCYNEPIDMLKKSIDSILNQTYKNLQIILVLDNPENIEMKTTLIEYEKKDSRVLLIINPANQGLIKSLNTALTVAKGKYICRMDADDISDTSRIEKQLDLMNEKGLDFVGTLAECINETDEYLSDLNLPIDAKSISAMLKRTNCMVHPSWLVKIDVFNKLRGYRNIFACEDYDFVVRAVINGFKIGNHPERLLKYRIRNTSISRSNFAKQVITADYIRANYKRGKIFTEEEYFEYINSNKVRNKIESYNKYLELKKETKKKMGIKSLLLFLYPSYLIKDFFKKIHS